ASERKADRDTQQEVERDVKSEVLTPSKQKQDAKEPVAKKNDRPPRDAAQAKVEEPTRDTEQKASSPQESVKEEVGSDEASRPHTSERTQSRAEPEKPPTEHAKVKQEPANTTR